MPLSLVWTIALFMMPVGVGATNLLIPLPRSDDSAGPSQPAQSERLTEEALKRTFETIDHSHDGKIDAEEAEKAEALRGAFARADLDQNGTLDVDEFREEFATGTMKKGGKVDDAVLQKIRESRESDAKFALDEKAHETLDSDEDGAVSLEELRAKVPPRRKNVSAWIEPFFTGADANHDGTLLADEWKEFQKALRDWAAVGRPAPIETPKPLKKPDKP